MTTSGTYTFELDTSEIIEEAYERCGLETKSGFELKTARRSLNLLLTKWVNDGVNLFTLDLTTTAMTKDQDNITLSSLQYLDIIDAALRDTNSTPDLDVSMEPTHYAIERNSQYTSSASATHKVYLWPVPDQTYYQLLSWTVRYPQDVSSTYTENPDIPRRYLPALISGLAVELANKRPAQVDINRRQELKAYYEQDWEKAREEDRERVSFYVQPKVRGYA